MGGETKREKPAGLPVEPIRFPSKPSIPIPSSWGDIFMKCKQCNKNEIDTSLGLCDKCISWKITEYCLWIISGGQYTDKDFLSKCGISLTNF